MNKMKAAMIGFLPRDGSDPYAVLESYAKMGYSAFEGADMLLREGDPAENLKKVQSFGMKPLAVHLGINTDVDVADVLERAKKTGVKRAANFCGCIGGYRFGGGTPPTYDDLMAECQRFDKAAKELAKEGISVTFHNHDAEFKHTFNGVPAFFLMVANTEYLKFEVDCGWVKFGGYDPVTVINQLGDRIGALHIKDYIEGPTVDQPTPNGGVNKNMPRFTTPGTGCLDLKGCLEAGLKAGMEYAIVEQDFQYNLTQAETLQAAYLNMKETGFVE